MAIQTINESSFIFLPDPLDPEPQSSKPIQVLPQDLSFEIGEEQLAAEMHAQLLRSPVAKTTLVIDTEELESVYQN